jgi:alpha-L-fucosidase
MFRSKQEIWKREQNNHRIYKPYRNIMMNKIFKIAAIIGLVFLFYRCEQNPPIPSYLNEYQKEYNANPREANLKWFTNARYGMFIHYGLYALLEKGEWVQLRDTIPVAEYALLKERFTADKFDADLITDLALAAGMKYITITSKHHDGFCLFETKATDFNVLNSPAKRDLIRELYEACEKKGLGLFLYYSYGADWKHPYFYSRESGWQHARPAYKDPQPEYKFENDDDFNIYVDFVHEQLTELLTQYPNIAGIWFDPIMGFYSRPGIFPIDSTYALIRSLSPHALISFKQGADGSEDFMAPERKGRAIVGQQFEVARKVYELNKDKPKEICNTLQPHAWGYNNRDDGQHKSAEDVIQMLEDAREMNANLLLNIGPKGDGSIPAEDIATLTEAGKIVAPDE